MIHTQRQTHDGRLEQMGCIPKRDVNCSLYNVIIDGEGPAAEFLLWISLPGVCGVLLSGVEMVDAVTANETGIVAILLFLVLRRFRARMVFIVTKDIQS